MDCLDLPRPAGPGPDGRTCQCVPGTTFVSELLGCAGECFVREGEGGCKAHKADCFGRHRLTVDSFLPDGVAHGTSVAYESNTAR
jgi:hypothetical protein